MGSEMCIRDRLYITYKICCFKDVVLNTRTIPYCSKLISTYITTYSYHVQYSIQFNIGFSVVSNVLHKTTVICWMNLGLPAMRHKVKFPQVSPRCRLLLSSSVSVCNPELCLAVLCSFHSSSLGPPPRMALPSNLKLTSKFKGRRT